ncbi:SOS response-associated peptidase [Sphingomonas solaris]|uniref:Abasic site processing protein n=2 Tax=Alterirhizorhabdus solaris TaxID=2529389 RepID=A0A558QRS2_9SPHN|nr:SOS response-associated peptidase [Sphingomonas solaris]
MTASQAEVAARYGIALPYPDDLTIPPPELFPKRPAYVIRDEAGQRALDVMAWGFPSPAAGSAPVTNVRNLASPFWRSALATPTRRCLVPFTAFSEYGPGEKGKLPLFWFDVPSQPIVSFAGIWRPTEAGPVFALLTIEPNAIVAPVHPKAMPVLLHAEDEAAWLTAGWEEAQRLVAPFPTQLMRVE